MNGKAQLVTSLWVGESLPLMGELCMKSFLDHGHSFQLFCYERYENIPAGVIVRDASEILPREAVFRDTAHHSLAPFADWFRMKFLAAEGGFWVDMDVVCLSPELPEEEVWFCRQNETEVAVGALKFPAGHPVPTMLAKLAEDPSTVAPWDACDEVMAKMQKMRHRPDKPVRRSDIPWGFCGPSGMTQALRYVGLHEQAAPPESMYPIPWAAWRSLYDGQAQLAAPEFRAAWAVHLWGEMVRREPQVWEQRHATSVASELLARHLPHTEQSPTSPEACESKKRVHILVGICSCMQHALRRMTCRNTWMSRETPGVTCVFYVGSHDPLPAEPDVIPLPVDDSYDCLTAKGLAFYHYALQHYDFEWLYKCDDDTYVALERLKELCDDRYDMIGDMSLARRGAPSGGAGYLMSRSLVELLVEHEEKLRSCGSEDLEFGYLARDLNARMHATERLQLGNCPYPAPRNDLVSCHWCSMQRMQDIDALLCGRLYAVCAALHPAWEDDLHFLTNGRFMRRNATQAGRYRFEHNGALLLLWDDGSTHRLKRTPRGFGNRRSLRICDPRHELVPILIGDPPSMKCVILTTPGEVAEGARRAMNLGYEVELYPTTQDTSALSDARYAESAAYISRPPESAERKHVRSLRASFIRMLRDDRYRRSNEIIFCESDAAPLLPAKEMLRFVQKALAAEPELDVLRLYRSCVWEKQPSSLEKLPADAGVERMTPHARHDADTAESWGTHALVIPARSREKVAQLFAEYRLPTDVTLALANGQNKLHVHSASHNFFAQAKRVSQPRQSRIAGMLSSYKRLKDLQRQIWCMMDQDYENFHLFAAVKGISEADYRRTLLPQFAHFIEEGRLTLRLFPNRNQLSNLLDTVRGLDISSYDLFAKIDDDDLYARDYISCVNRFHSLLPPHIGSYYTGCGGYLRSPQGYPTIHTRPYGLFGPTLVFPRQALELLQNYERDPESIMPLFPPQEHDYLRANFGLREDALIDFLNRRLGACNRAAYMDLQGKQLSIAICEDTPSVMRGDYVSPEMSHLMHSTRITEQANERVLTLESPHWRATARMLGDRLHLLERDEPATVLHVDEHILHLRWDRWGEERFLRQADGVYALEALANKC